MWTVFGERLQHCIWLQLITLSLSPSLPIQSNEPTGSALHFNVSILPHGLTFKLYKEYYYVFFHHILSSGHLMRKQGLNNEESSSLFANPRITTS